MTMQLDLFKTTKPAKPARKRVYNFFKMVAVKDWGKNQPVTVDAIACGRKSKSEARK